LAVEKLLGERGSCVLAELLLNPDFLGGNSARADRASAGNFSLKPVSFGIPRCDADERAALTFALVDGCVSCESCVEM
jgi:hypothetical protein